MGDDYFRSVPILAFSAVVETKEKAMEMGMTDYANKPINPSELQSKISQYAFSTIASPESRKLRIDFNVYTDGDEEFKQELTSLMINNLHELGKSVDLASEPGGNDALHRVIHKVKPTLGMLNDSEVTETVELLKSADVKDTAFDKLKKRFSSLNLQIIVALQKELKPGHLVFVPAKAA
jgi:response regulator RpfG family c-di-GMP phosphodiesterase